MNKDHRSQEPPCPSLSIHMQHAQDLEKANAPATYATSAHHRSVSFILFIPFYYFCCNKKAKVHRAIAARPDGRCGKHLAIGPDAKHNDGGNDDNQICGMETHRKKQLNTQKE